LRLQAGLNGLGTVLAQQARPLQHAAQLKNGILARRRGPIRGGVTGVPVITPVDPIEALGPRALNPVLDGAHADPEPPGDSALRTPLSDRLHPVPALSFLRGFLPIAHLEANRVFSPR
jgi:hypothetical protein